MQQTIGRDSAPRGPAPGNEISASLDKRWWGLLPAVFVTYSLAYLDRANFGFGAAAGMAATLHITQKETSLLGALFFLGYFVFQVPGVLLARRYSLSRAVFVALIAWGSLAALTGVIHVFWLLAIDRLLLGVAESLIFPVMLLLLTRWFTRAERARANTILIFGNPITVLWMSAITGFLIQRFGWQTTFILEGLPSILWAPIWLATVRDQPRNVRWLSPDAVGVLEQRLSEEQLSVAPISAIRSALRRADVLLLSVMYFFWSLSAYGFILWMPTMIRRGANLSMGRTGLLSMLPYLAAILLMLLVAFIADRTQRNRSLVWQFLLLSGIALTGSAFIAQRSFPLAMAGLVIGGGCLYAPYGSFFAIVPQRIPRNLTAEVFILINSIGALGGFCGVYFVGALQAATGSSRASYLLMSFSILAASGLIFFLPDPPPTATSQ
jgi:sugar phosphate permease